MARTAIRLLVVIVALSVTAAAATADERGSGAKSLNKLIGTWRQVLAKYGGREHRFPEGVTTVKHITPSAFMWVTYDSDGNVMRAAGGPYTIKDEEYRETPEYGLGPDFTLIKGKAQTFTWKVEGDKWYHNGKLSNGLTIEEVWERVEQE